MRHSRLIKELTVRFLKAAAVMVCFTIVFSACRAESAGDKLAWEDLAAISEGSLHPNGAQSDQFRPLHCTPETEIEMNFPNPLSLGLLRAQRQSTVDGNKQCEQIFINGAIAEYVIQNELWNRNKLAAAAQANRVNLPAKEPFSRQIKTEWRRIDKAQSMRYITALNDQGQLYGVVAIHMMSHELPTWLWASWLHEDFAGVMPREIGFHDSFGRKDEAGPVTDALQAVLSANGAEVLSHYKLIGTQTNFEDPVHLGNPLIEGTNAQNLSQRLLNSSCITCHRYAVVAANGGRTRPRRQTGPATVPDGFYPVDFSFSLAGRPQCMSGPGCNLAGLR